MRKETPKRLYRAFLLFRLICLFPSLSSRSSYFSFLPRSFTGFLSIFLSFSLSLSLFLDASGLLAHNARARFFWSRVQKPRRACGFLRNGRVNHQLPAREKGRGWRVAAAPPWLSLRQFRAISSRQRERTKTHENTRDSRFTVHRLPGRQEFERHAVI